MKDEVSDNDGRIRDGEPPVTMKAAQKTEPSVKPRTTKPVHPVPASRYPGDETGFSNEERALAFELIGDLAVVGRAGIFKRLAAGLIDITLVLIFIVWPCMVAVTFSSDIDLNEADSFELSSDDPEQFIEEHQTLFNAIQRALILSGILVIVYFAITEGTLGQSIGKAFMDIGVIAEDTSPLGISAALGRNVLKGTLIASMVTVLAPVVLVVFLIDVISLIYADKHQRYLDRFVGSVCVEGYVLEHSKKGSTSSTDGEFITFKGADKR